MKRNIDFVKYFFRFLSTPKKQLYTEIQIFRYKKLLITIKIVCQKR
jgi:hypothetical protein